jgi:hypothetical protein
LLRLIGINLAPAEFREGVTCWPLSLSCFTDDLAMKAMLIQVSLTRVGGDHGSTEEATSGQQGKIARACKGTQAREVGEVGKEKKGKTNFS